MYPYRAALIFWGRDKCRVSHSVNCHNMSVKTAPVCLRPSVAEQWESSLTSNQRSFNTVLLNTAQTASSQQCRPFTARTSFSPQMIYCCPSVARNYKSHERILYGGHAGHFGGTDCHAQHKMMMMLCCGNPMARQQNTPKWQKTFISSTNARVYVRFNTQPVFTKLSAFVHFGLLRLWHCCPGDGIDSLRGTSRAL